MILMTFANGAIIKCPHCENNNVKPPHGDRLEWYCPKCMKMFNKPVEMLKVEDKSPIPKISPAELSIEQIERLDQLVMKNVVHQAAKNFLKDDPNAYRDVLGSSHTVQLADAKIVNELWTRSHKQKIDINKLVEDILWQHLFPNELRTQFFGNQRSRNWREAKQRRQPTINVCPHCGSQNFGRPLINRYQYICFDCEHFFRQPVKKEWQSEPTSQSNSSKSSNEPAEAIFDVQIKPEHEPKTKVKMRPSRPKQNSRYWRRKARKTVFRGMCPRCGTAAIRRPRPKKTTFINQIYRTKQSHCKFQPVKWAMHPKEVIA